MIILLHSSKTMKAQPRSGLRAPCLLDRARELGEALKTLTPAELTKSMQLSPALAQKTHALLAGWTDDPAAQTPAVDSFIGDIYSGLHANDLPAADRDYADETLRILSGLYGILRPYDGICPYRLEMGYKLPQYPSLYAYWGDAIAQCLPVDGPIINLAAEEYSKTITPYVDPARVVAPRFLTVSPKTGAPEFVVVHAKIARGAFARWLITHRITDPAQITGFDEIGYQYEPGLSGEEGPTFVAETFEGKGLSIRLQ